MNASATTRYDFVLHVARVVLEATTPLSISTGASDGVFDSALVRDANGLPALPATSVAGVLRSLWTQEKGTDSARELFGFQARADGLASRLHVGWGSLLDSRGRATTGLLLGVEAERLRTDPILKDVVHQHRMPLHRNRVRLTHRGAAADAGKFDRTILPAGHRFALELRLQYSADGSEDIFRKLLAFFSHPGFRLGGGTRAGLGGMRCVSLHTARFDLRDPGDVRAVGALGADPSSIAGLKSIQPGQVVRQGWIESFLELRAEGLWRIGQGDVPVEQTSGADKVPDLLPITERRIEWGERGGRPRSSREALIPGSSVKGVLAHRTAFHARRFAGQWAETQDVDSDRDIPPEVRALFGEVKNKPSEGVEGVGWAGCMFFDDAYLTLSKPVRLMHNSIDRFTGGVREHMLFEEECLTEAQTRIRVAVDLERLARSLCRYGLSVEQVQRSFVAALRDLCDGRLALGAKSTTGHGVFRGKPPIVLCEPWLKAAS